MITAKTPGAYHIGRAKNKGYYKRINRQEVEEMRRQNLPWAEIAGRLGVTIKAIMCQREKWRRESKNAPDGAGVREP